MANSMLLYTVYELSIITVYDPPCLSDFANWKCETLQKYKLFRTYNSILKSQYILFHHKQKILCYYGIHYSIVTVHTIFIVIIDVLKNLFLFIIFNLLCTLYIQCTVYSIQRSIYIYTVYKYIYYIYILYIYYIQYTVQCIHILPLLWLTSLLHHQQILMDDGYTMIKIFLRLKGLSYEGSKIHNQDIFIYSKTNVFLFVFMHFFRENDSAVRYRCRSQVYSTFRGFLDITRTISYLYVWRICIRSSLCIFVQN